MLSPWNVAACSGVKPGVPLPLHRIGAAETVQPQYAPQLVWLDKTDFEPSLAPVERRHRRARSVKVLVFVR